MSTVSINSTEMRRKKASQNTLIKSTKSNYENSNITRKTNINSSDDDSLIYPKIRASNSNISKNKDLDTIRKPSNIKNNQNINSKSLKKPKSNVQLIEKRNDENNNRYSDSDYSDMPTHYNQNKISNRTNRLHPINKSITRTTASRNINRGNKSSISLVLSSSDSSSESLRIKKDKDTYRTINYKSDDSESDKHQRYQNTIDTVLESDTSDDIPFIDTIENKPEIDFKSNRKPYLQEESTENFEQTEKFSPKKKSPKKSTHIKNSNDSEEQKSDDEIDHQKEISNNEENITTSTSSDNLNYTEQKKHRKSNKSTRNDGIVRTKHFHSGDKYRIPKKKRKSIQINVSDSEENDQKIENKDVNENENEQKQNESSHSNSQNETESQNIVDELILDAENENDQGEEFEKGVRNTREIKRLCSLFMKRLPGYKIPNNLIPYKMFTDTKISFHGKKAKFTLFRGETPLLIAKLKNKSGSDPIVNIYKYTQKPSSSKKEKKKEKSKNKKDSPIALIMTGLNFTTFSLRKSELKSEVPKNDTENDDDLYSIHSLYGPGFGKELMTVMYSMAKVDYAPRIVKAHFTDPPHPIPNELISRKPKFTYGSTCILDIGGRVAKKSIKNCIMVDENNKDWMSIMKIHDSEVSIEVYPTISELCVFAFGISSVLCKL